MDNNEYIDSYFREEHSAEATAAFDEKVKQDPAFAEAVAFYCSSLQVAKNQLTEDKKQHFRELYAQTGPSVSDEPAPVRSLIRWRTIITAAAIVAGLLAGLYLYRQPDASLQQVADRYIKEQLATVGVNMGAQEEDSIGRARQFYSENKLPEALVAFEAIARANATSDEAKKMAGIVSLRLGNYDKAINYFTQLEEQPILYNPGKLYHALALIKRNQPGDTAAAKQLLLQVAEQQPAYQETAVKWLKAF